jgi:hypothetical protein
MILQLREIASGDYRSVRKRTARMVKGIKVRLFWLASVVIEEFFVKPLSVYIAELVSGISEFCTKILAALEHDRSLPAVHE